MNEKMDQLIRLAAKQDLTLPEGLEERTMKKIEQRTGEKNKTKFQIAFRPAVAVLLLAAVCLAASPAIAKYKPIAKYLSNEPYKNNKETEKKLQEFHMEIDRVEEQEIDLGTFTPFSKIKITPQTAVSDGFATYVVIKVEGTDGFVLEDDMVLDDDYGGISSLYSGGIEDVGDMEDIYLSEKKENALYYTMSLWGTQVSLKEEVVIDIGIRNLVRTEVDENGRAMLPREGVPVIDPGLYLAKIYCKVSGTPKIREFAVTKELPYGMRISPLGIQFKGLYINTVERLEKAVDLSVLLEDGRKVPLNIHGSSREVINNEYVGGDDDPVWNCISAFQDIISDTDDIRYLVVDGEKYDLKKIEKNQK